MRTRRRHNGKTLRNDCLLLSLQPITLVTPELALTTTRRIAWIGKDDIGTTRHRREICHTGATEFGDDKLIRQGFSPYGQNKKSMAFAEQQSDTTNPGRNSAVLLSTCRHNKGQKLSTEVSGDSRRDSALTTEKYAAMAHFPRHPSPSFSLRCIAT